MNFNKDAGMVSSSTAGVNNSMHARRLRRNHLKIYGTKVFNAISKGMIVKDDKMEDLADYIEEQLYSKSFAGVKKSISELIKDYILKSVVRGYEKPRVMKYLEKKGIEPKQAQNIFQTETNALRNKTREWSYKQIDPNDQLKYKWIGPKDHRTTPICKAITQRTGEGVSLDTLKKIISEEVSKAKDEGKLPEDYDAREYTPHYQCRHTFIRTY